MIMFDIDHMVASLPEEALVQVLLKDSISLGALRGAFDAIHQPRYGNATVGGNCEVALRIVLEEEIQAPDSPLRAGLEHARWKVWIERKELSPGRRPDWGQQIST